MLFNLCFIIYLSAVFSRYFKFKACFLSGIVVYCVPGRSGKCCEPISLFLVTVISMLIPNIYYTHSHLRNLFGSKRLAKSVSLVIHYVKAQWISDSESASWTTQHSRQTLACSTRNLYDLSDERVRCDKQTGMWSLSLENTDDQKSHLDILGYGLIPSEAIMPGCVLTPHSVIVGSLSDV